MGTAQARGVEVIAGDASPRPVAGPGVWGDGPGRVTSPVVGGARVARRGTVLLVVADQVVRAALEQGLRHRGNPRVIRARTGGAVTDLIAQRMTDDLAVVSVQLSGHTDVIRALRAGGWDRVLAISSSREVGPILAAVAAGATGVLCWPPAQRVPTAHRRRVRALSDRELQVLGHVAAGCSNKEIAAVLSLSPLTVKRHLARIQDALGARDRANMVAIALRTGALTGPRPPPDLPPVEPCHSLPGNSL